MTAKHTPPGAEVAEVPRRRAAADDSRHLSDAEAIRHVDGGSDPAEHARVAAHAAACPSCRALVDRYRTLVFDLAAMVPPPDMLRVGLEGTQPERDLSHEHARDDACSSELPDSPGEPASPDALPGGAPDRGTESPVVATCAAPAAHVDAARIRCPEWRQVLLLDYGAPCGGGRDVDLVCTFDCTFDGLGDRAPVAEPRDGASATAPAALRPTETLAAELYREVYHALFGAWSRASEALHRSKPAASLAAERAAVPGNALAALLEGQQSGTLLDWRLGPGASAAPCLVFIQCRTGPGRRHTRFAAAWRRTSLVHVRECDPAGTRPPLQGGVPCVVWDECASASACRDAMRRLLSAAAQSELPARVRCLEVAPRAVIAPTSRRVVGVELPATPGRVVRAMAPGIVAALNREHGRGMTIVLDHGDGVESVYRHVMSRLLDVGKPVECGQPIAQVSRVPARGGRLFFQLRMHGVPIDPSSHLLVHAWRGRSRAELVRLPSSIRVTGRALLADVRTTLGLDERTTRERAASEAGVALPPGHRQSALLTLLEGLRTSREPDTSPHEGNRDHADHRSSASAATRDAPIEGSRGELHSGDMPAVDTVVVERMGWLVRADGSRVAITSVS